MSKSFTIILSRNSIKSEQISPKGEACHIVERWDKCKFYTRVILDATRCRTRSRNMGLQGVCRSCCQGLISILVDLIYSFRLSLLGDLKHLSPWEIYSGFDNRMGSCISYQQTETICLTLTGTYLGVFSHCIASVLFHIDRNMFGCFLSHCVTSVLSLNGIKILLPSSLNICHNYH